jgi:hypothetical protein
MAERSMYWDGASYNGNVLDDVFEYMLTAGLAGKSGVFRGVGNMLAVSGVATPVLVRDGAACVKGKIYTNGSDINIAVASPAAATRIDRIILRATFAGAPGTVTCVRLAGTEGTGLPPVLTQVDGTTWEISLAQVSITTGGVITVISERRPCKLQGDHSKGDIMHKACSLFGHYPIDVDMGGPDYDWHLANGDTENGVVCPNIADRFIMSAGAGHAATANGGSETGTLPNHLHSDGTLATAGHDHTGTTGDDDNEMNVCTATSSYMVASNHHHPYTTPWKAGLDVTGATGNPTSSPTFAVLNPFYTAYCFVYVGPNNVAI